eukprot:CAMPEP_0194424280 /NCGR_PEP_ID=MMETSP0176-20130528/23551_1 /TAXON_ID=216777 /ORGANISM="Proboscia alata, Strain PI-D3" /LENGTH=132 /DNA_ID=CAMNT_0039233949 /DNA_START=593 /DNA_END=991 /DNA_ORIENTATION=+
MSNAKIFLPIRSQPFKKFPHAAAQESGNIAARHETPIHPQPSVQPGVSTIHAVPIQINTFVQSDTDQFSFLQVAAATAQESGNVAAQGPTLLLDLIYQKPFVQSDLSSLVPPTQQIVSHSCITSLLHAYYGG